MTTFEFKPEAGVKYSKITALGDDICLALEAESVRIDRIPGKSTVGIEVPNDERAIADRFGKALFRMSSLLPPHAIEAAAGKGLDVRPCARAFVFNAGIEAIADFFDIGTRPAVAADR